MIIVVNDANILIDLVKLKLLPHFFSLQLKFYTSDFILNELHYWQVKELQVYVDNGTLTVIHGIRFNTLPLAIPPRYP